MEKLVKGDVIVIKFPFADFSSTKRRPAFIAATPEGDDVIICQITSSRHDKYCVKIDDSDFKKGKLQIPSSIRANKILTMNKSLVEFKVGTLKESKVKETIAKIEEILRN